MIKLPFVVAATIGMNPQLAATSIPLAHNGEHLLSNQTELAAFLSDFTKIEIVRKLALEALHISICEKKAEEQAILGIFEHRPPAPALELPKGQRRAP